MRHKDRCGAGISRWAATGIVISVLAVTGCGRAVYGSSASAGRAVQSRVAAGGMSCAQARAIVRRQVGYLGALSCRKAFSWAESLPGTAQGLERSGATATASPSPSPSLPPGFSPPPVPEPSPELPADAGQVQTGPDISQWQESGTTITSLWMDLEAGLLVQIEGESLDSNTQQGQISIAVIDENTNDGGSINGYTGGDYPTPQQVGPVTLTGVTGSLATGDMVISFSYPGGTGTFDPASGQFTMS